MGGLFMVNSVSGTNYYTGYNEVKYPQEMEETNIFSVSDYQTPPANDTVSFSGAAEEKKCNVDDLKAEYEQIQKEQGIVGKAWNGIKNALPFLSKIGCKGSKEIEEIIAKAENGEISAEEAQKEIEKYKKNQKTGTETALNTATAAIATVACLLAGPVGWATLAVGVGAGIVSRVALGATDAATNEIEGDYTGKNVAEDAGKGAVIGLISAGFRYLGLKGGKGFIIREALDTDKKALGAVSKGVILARGLKA